MKDCIDILKENMMKLANSEQKDELQEIFSKEIEVPPTQCFDVDADDEYITLDSLMENYFTEEDKKQIGLI